MLEEETGPGAARPPGSSCFPEERRSPSDPLRPPASKLPDFKTELQQVELGTIRPHQALIRGAQGSHGERRRVREPPERLEAEMAGLALPGPWAGKDPPPPASRLPTSSL